MFISFDLLYYIETACQELLSWKFPESQESVRLRLPVGVLADQRKGLSNLLHFQLVH